MKYTVLKDPAYSSRWVIVDCAGNELLAKRSHRCTKQRIRFWKTKQAAQKVADAMQNRG